MENNFWQVNFWGVVGAVTGIIGLIISWLSWRYTHPKIKITRAKLNIREYDHKFLLNKKDIDLRSLKRTSLKIILDIKLKNERGGPGAIEKPTLLFKVNKYFWQRSNHIEIQPITKSYQLDKLSEDSWENKIIDLGKSYNLNGGGIIDDELEYSIHGSNGNLQKLIEHYGNGNFYIHYSNNTGAKYEIKPDIEFFS